MLYVTNKSTLVTNAQVETMTRACARQLAHHVAPLWSRLPVPVVYTEQPQTAAPGTVVITITDKSDLKDAFGYHSEKSGDIEYAIVAAGPVFDNGGDALTKPLSVASVLSHEICEWFVDPKCNLAADTGLGYAVAYEVCDPVESDSYQVRIVPRGAKKTTQVTVSNFVLPAWFDPFASSTQSLDYLGTCKKPFVINPGGYAVQIKEGKATEVYGKKFPAWRKELKTSRRYGMRLKP